MLDVWVSLAVSAVAVVATGIYAGRLGWATFKDAKRLSRTLRPQLDALTKSTAKLEQSAARLEQGSARMQRSLARLSVSRRRLAVLTGALDEVETTLGRFAFFFPRK